MVHLFIVKTLHISSCTSDAHLGSDEKYGGIAIFARNDKQDWYAANKTHCKSGHVVLKQADTRKFEGLQTNWRERGRIHGIIYRMACGKSCADARIVGEGFGITEGQFKTTSGAFNLACEHRRISGSHWFLQRQATAGNMSAFAGYIQSCSWPSLSRFSPICDRRQEWTSGRAQDPTFLKGRNTRTV